jgi:hypothetical protein
MKNELQLYNLLFQCASQTLLTLAADRKRLNAHIGVTAILANGLFLAILRVDEARYFGNRIRATGSSTHKPFKKATGRNTQSIASSL